MLVRAPLVEAEQDSSVRIDDLAKIGMGVAVPGADRPPPQAEVNDSQSMSYLTCGLQC